jgi:signal transduction histidine kinase
VLALIAFGPRGADNPTMRWRKALAAAALGAIAGLLGAGLTMHVIAVADGLIMPAPFALPALVVVGVAVQTAVGSVAIWKQPRNLVGWCLLSLAAANALSGFVSGYAELGVLVHPGSLPAAGAALVVANAGWVLVYASLTALALIFPDGRLPSPKWRPAAIGVGLATLAAGSTVALFPGAGNPPFEHIQNPAGIGLLAGPLLPLLILSLAGLLGGLLVGASAIAIRFRRARGVERLQLKWLAYAGGCVPAVLVLCWISELVWGGPGLAFGIAFTFINIAIPIAVGIAIFHHGLYNVDRLINRTLVYSSLTVLLAAAFAAMTLILGVLLGRGSVWATAGATLAVAVAFGPLRRWLQKAVDWRFDRNKYDALRAVEGFLEDVRRGQASPEQVGDVLRRALRDPTLELLYWLPESEIYVDNSGQPVGEPNAKDFRARTPMERGQTRLGLLLHDAALLERRELLRSVTSASGLAVEIARLRVEVRVQLAEVQASRSRILAAGYAERRQIERDLHDGAQQRLVSLGVSLRLLQRGLNGADLSLRSALDAAVAEVGRTITDLRELARGVRPARLDQGLDVAISDLARRSSIPVDLDLSGERLSSDIEAAAYFVACEALTNTIKHAAASRATVRTARQNGHFIIRVEDDGIGGAHLVPGSGLAGLTDRVDAHGGRLRIDSRPGGGTLVEAELPCES